MLEYFNSFLIVLSACMVIISYLKRKRRNSIIAIDFDTLVDVDPIIERGKIYVSNKKNASLEQYFAAHVSEQQPIPQGILKAIHYQRVGYKIIYFSCRPEYLRLETAKVLNNWGLKGELYMNTYNDENIYFKGQIITYIQKNKGKLVGVVDNSEVAYKAIYEWNKIRMM